MRDRLWAAVLTVAVGFGAPGCLGGGGGGGGGGNGESGGGSGAPNQAPEISSAPVTGATEDQAYQYQVAAADPEGTSLTFSLDTRPTGMTVDGAGVVRWTPTNGQVGAHAVTVRVRDAAGASDTQSYTVTVANVNDAPEVTSAPVTFATQGFAYAYDVDASDVDASEQLTFSLPTKPAGMSIGGTSGQISWTPTAGQVGSHAVTVRVTDLAGAFDEQSFTVNVSNANDAPGITSSAITSATEDAAYTYDVNASDSDAGDQLTFTLTTKPTGMTINASSGVISWTPTNAQVGGHSVTVRVTDLAGAFDTQSFTVTVQNVNDAPTITSSAVTSAVVGAAYSYDVNAQDVDASDSVTFSLTTKPTGMTINATSGLISWTPTAGQAGSNPVTVRATDLAGAFASQSFSVSVATPVEITTTSVPAGMVGQSYSQTIAATGGTAPRTFSLDGSSQSLPSGLSLSSAGVLSGNPSQAATRNIVVRVQDGSGGSDTQALTLTTDPTFTATPSTQGTVLPAGQETIAVAGGLAPYGAVFGTNNSGGQVAINGSTVTYTAGSTNGTDTVDVFDARGRVLSVDFVVSDGADPFENFHERYGQTDNWRLNFDAKRDSSHSFRSDFEKELASIGLRAANATGAGGQHDELALQLVKLYILRHTAQLYQLNEDGSLNQDSFQISFFADTPATGTAPPERSSLIGALERFNIMEMGAHDASQDSVLGRAFVDSGNFSVEHDGGGSGTSALGVDMKDCARIYRNQHGSKLLTSDPVSAADVSILQQLLQGQVPDGARAAEIELLADHFSFRIAVVTAHEVGHSLGLNHNGGTESIMSSTVSFGNSLNPSFSSGDATTLESDLPGFGRLGSVSSSAVAAATVVSPADFTFLPITEMRMSADGSRVECSCGASLSLER